MDGSWAETWEVAFPLYLGAENGFRVWMKFPVQQPNQTLLKVSDPRWAPVLSSNNLDALRSESEPLPQLAWPDC